MKIHRFFAPTAREALSQVRDTLGPDAIILSNRSMGEGVEILASIEREFTSTVHNNSLAHTPPLSNNSLNDLPKIQSEPKLIPPNPESSMESVINEIRAMRGALENQLSVLSWQDQQNRNPTKTGLLREFLAMGFSASLSRYLAENVPEDNSLEQGLLWAKNTLSRNLSYMQNENELLDQGGVFALVGPTGVGKTTTTAKLAARYVMRHGASNLALITTDSYRIGAHEQLRIYGKILGVIVHSVRDETDLRIALDELKTKHTILIDTVGMSQRDQMVAEQIAMLAGTRTPIRRLLCMNASSTIETLNEVVTAYRGSGLEGSILTKLDETVTMSNTLDVVLRQKLKLFYIATGQRVPEDLEMVNPDRLLNKAFEHRHNKSATRLEDSELPILLSSDVAYPVPDLQGIHVV